MKFLKNNQWYIILGAVCLIIGVVIGLRFSHSRTIIIPVTNYIQGNVVYIPKYNTITNWYPYYNQLSDYDTDSFQFVQTGDTIKVQLACRYAYDKLYDFHIENPVSIGVIGVVDCQGPAAGPNFGYSGSWYDVHLGAFYGNTNNWGVIANGNLRF